MIPHPQTAPHANAGALPDALGEDRRGPLSIDLWCNYVAGGWSPHDIDLGLGGSEECIVLWAEALAQRGHRVRVFHNPARPGEATARREVSYFSHIHFDPQGARDVLVSWKSPHPWSTGARAGRRIHWSSDVERPWPARMVERIDAFVTLTPYHRGALPWLPAEKARIVPHGIDLAQLERCRAERIPGRAIYASSPDRGLVTLLRDWPRLRFRHPELTLDVFYGWRQFRACHAGDPRAERFRADVERLLGQEGIRHRGQVSREEMAQAYWQAEYWLHPLDRAESELFCLNALKAAHGGALAVCNRIGALGDTVTRWVDYEEFRRGGRTVHSAAPHPILDWHTVVERYWEPLFQGR